MSSASTVASNPQIRQGVITLTPFDSDREPLPDLGEGATVVLWRNHSRIGSRRDTVRGCIEHVKLFVRTVRPGVVYSDCLYGIRRDDGVYTVMFRGELKDRLVSYLWDGAK